ncbi:serine protease [Erythrobacter litoralis]|uniref:Serine protease, trypsin family protein n=1 Tax=Erythrobacter litoralis (strain HTCC2594) TaxID=314225 RepID=Q2NDU8_ERYLH|nr:serine protease [Erythrobacter litoralis]ABC62143.1 serine protease, trypsin family protein [Erythrobacter litoralis HTCC2594]
MMVTARWAVFATGLLLAWPFLASAQVVEGSADVDNSAMTEPGPPEPEDAEPVNEAQAPDSFDSSFPHNGFITTLVRISPDIVERRAEIVAAIEAQPGWAIGDEDDAEFEVVPNPEYYQDLLFARIKRREFDRSHSRLPSEAMDIADIMVFHNPETGVSWNDLRGKGNFPDPARPKVPHWGLDVPVPVDLGPADGADLISRLQAAMAPVARHHALLGLVNDQGGFLKLCVSNDPAPEGYCPVQERGDRPMLLYFKPFYIRAVGEDSLPGSEMTFLAVAPDRAIVHLATVPIARVREIGPGGEELSAFTVGDNYEAPARMEEFGDYQVIAIASPDILDPRIWQIRPGDPLPQDLCTTEIQLRVCETMRGNYRIVGDRPLTTGLVEFKVFTDAWNAVAPVGGGQATREEGLWQAQLFAPRAGSPTGFSGVLSPGGGRRLNFEKSHKCGGSYIGDGYILTAAHCVDKVGLRDYQVRLGTLDIRVGGSNFPIESMVIHSRYRQRRDKADIALLRIKTDRRLDRLLGKGLVAPAPLAPMGRRLPQNSAVDMTGWGFTSAATPGGDSLVDAEGNTQRNAAKLMKVPLKTSATSTCTRHRQLSVYASADIVCTLPAREGTGACFSDSGGPLTRRVGGRRQLVGIVSAGIGCAQPGMPTAYTRIANFRSWIERAKVAARVPGKHRIP